MIFAGTKLLQYIHTLLKGKLAVRTMNWVKMHSTHCGPCIFATFIWTVMWLTLQTSLRIYCLSCILSARHLPRALWELRCLSDCLFVLWFHNLHSNVPGQCTSSSVAIYCMNACEENSLSTFDILTSHHPSVICVQGCPSSLWGVENQPY